MSWITSQAFRANPTDDATVQKFAVEAKEDGDKIRFTITDGSVDRENDTIAPGGWELSSYRKNPVVLWAHDHSQLPVGRGEIEQKDDRLEAVTEFAPTPFAQTVKELVKGGFLRTVSVGFRPLEWTFNEERGGVDFKKQELLEFSIVPVPANPNALVAASAAGIDISPVKEWVSKALAALPDDVRAEFVSDQIVERDGQLLYVGIDEDGEPYVERADEPADVSEEFDVAPDVAARELDVGTLTAILRPNGTVHEPVLRVAEIFDTDHAPALRTEEPATINIDYDQLADAIAARLIPADNDTEAYLELDDSIEVDPADLQAAMAALEPLVAKRAIAAHTTEAIRYFRGAR